MARAVSAYHSSRLLQYRLSVQRRWWVDQQYEVQNMTSLMDDDRGKLSGAI